MFQSSKKFNNLKNLESQKSKTAAPKSNFKDNAPEEEQFYSQPYSPF